MCVAAVRGSDRGVRRDVEDVATIRIDKSLPRWMGFKQTQIVSANDRVERVVMTKRTRHLLGTARDSMARGIEDGTSCRKSSSSRSGMGNGDGSSSIPSFRQVEDAEGAIGRRRDEMSRLDG